MRVLVVLWWPLDRPADEPHLDVCEIEMRGVTTWGCRVGPETDVYFDREAFEAAETLRGQTVTDRDARLSMQVIRELDLGDCVLAAALRAGWHNAH